MGSRAENALRAWRSGGLGGLVRRAARYLRRKQAEQRLAERIRLSPEELARQRAEAFDRPVRFSVAVPLYNTPERFLREMIASVREQTFRDWELCLADGSDGGHGYVGEICRELAAEDSRIRYRKLERNGGISENSNAAVEMTVGDYIALLDHDDLLTPDALYEMRRAIGQTGADFLYSDEMVFSGDDPERPEIFRLKPGFSPDTLLTNNYICHLTVFSRELWEKDGGFRKEYDGSQDHDLFLRLIGRAKGIAHVSKVLYRWRSAAGSTAADIRNKEYAVTAGRAAVEDFLRREWGVSAEVESTELFPALFRVRFPVEGQPSARVILDAREEKTPVAERLRALQRCAGWECGWTVILSGEEDLPEGFECLRAAPEESRWKLMNRAAESAEEEYLLFGAGVPETGSEGWLRELLSRARLPHAGAAGPLLLDREGKILSAGAALSREKAPVRRLYRGENPDLGGYFGETAAARDVSVLMDWLMVFREKWREVGGFPEAYQDALAEAELCLRLTERGYYNLFTPHAALRFGDAGRAFPEADGERGSAARDAETFRERNARALSAPDPFLGGGDIAGLR